MGLFMNIQMERDGDWKRIRPHQAAKALGRRARNGGLAEMEDDKISSLLGQDESE